MSPTFKSGLKLGLFQGLLGKSSTSANGFSKSSRPASGSLGRGGPLFAGVLKTKGTSGLQ